MNKNYNSISEQQGVLYSAMSLSVFSHNTFCMNSPHSFVLHKRWCVWTILDKVFH